MVTKDRAIGHPHDHWLMSRKSRSGATATIDYGDLPNARDHPGQGA